jgi:hypothetical protein
MADDVRGQRQAAEGDHDVMIKQTHSFAAQVAPHAAVGLLVVAAAASHAAASASGHEAQVALWVAGTAFVLAVLVGMKRGARIECRKARARLQLLLAGSAAWLGAVTGAGLSWGAVEILVLMVGALSLHWWRMKRIPNRAAAVAEPVGDYAARWRESIGCPGGAAPGSRLVKPEAIESGVRFDLRLVPGKQDASTITGAMEKIRGGLGLFGDQELLVEPHPTLPEPHQIATVVTKSPIRAEILWPGPSTFDSATGTVALGPFADGIGVGRWRVYSRSRLYGGYLQGGTDSGKSRTIDSIMASIAASRTHPTVVQYADGQGGASSAMLSKYADRVAKTSAECLSMLQDAVKVMEMRQDENDLEGWIGFTPRLDRPGLLIVIDECHLLLVFPEIQEAVAAIAKGGGKVGVACVLASQTPLLSAFGGSGKNNFADDIRSNLLMGNGLVLRSKSKDVSQVFGVPVNPSSFPATPGYAYLVDSIGRSAPLRSYHFTDQQAAAYLPGSEWLELDAGAANAAGPTYLNRRAIRDRAAAAKRERVEALKAGRPLPKAAPATALAAPLPAVTAFPVWISPPRPVSPIAPAGPRVTDIHHRATEALAGGAVRAGFTMPGWMARELGCSERWAHETLKDLVALGVLERPDGTPQGRYYPTGKTLSRKVA